MKILFLDFDGVMNFWPKTPQDAIDLGGYCTAKCLEPCRVKILNQFVAETGVKIVVSSSWRRHPDYLNNLPALIGMMREAGVVGEIIGVTPSFGYRDEEILEWLSEHPEVTNYVAFDDDRFDMGKLGDHFVHCFHTKGLTIKNAEEAKLALMFSR